MAQEILHPRKQQGKVFDGLVLNGVLQEHVRTQSGIKDFIWHGIRHLAETKTAELRDQDGKPCIPPYVRDVLFDHASSRGAGKGYDHHDYIPEMREALGVWADHVQRLVRPKKGCELNERAPTYRE